jgi:von Willebrand factor
MNTKRRAELQRKLTLNAVPRPPAGLSERIKADIPKHLVAETTSSRFTRAMGIPMRIAAAILLLVTSVVVAVNYMQTGTGKETMAPGPFAPAARTSISDAAASAPTDEVHLEIRQDAPLEESPMPQLAATNVAPPLVEPRRERRAADEQFADREELKKESLAAESDFAAEPQQLAEALPAAPPPPPVAAAAPASAPTPQAMDRAITVTAEVPTVGLVSQAHAAKIAMAPKDSVFGISIDPGVFEQIRATLENGGRPNVSEVDVEALVNYFAGKPDKHPKSGVRFEVEASPAAVEADGDHAVLRFSVDTPAAPTTPGSIPPIASDARLEVSFNDKVVAHAKRVGDGEALSHEPVLLYGTSVTGLYALELKPNLKSSQLVASVTLHYTTVSDGRKHSIKRVVHGHDLVRSWGHASRRHRLASLGAVWGETLRGTSAGFDLARKAEELATQDPKNPRAQELAAAASASGGGSR